jgi:hypothetical protein
MRLLLIQGKGVLSRAFSLNHFVLAQLGHAPRI